MAYKSPADVLSAVLNSSTSADLNVRVSAPISMSGVVSMGTLETISVSTATALPVSTGVVTVAQSAAVSTMLDPYATVDNGWETAAAASTAYPAASAGVACVSVVFKAHPGNSGRMFIGGSAVDGATNGFPLAAGDAISMRITNVNKVYYWAVTANDRLCWLVINT